MATAYLSSEFDSIEFNAQARAKEAKPLLVSSQSYFTDSNFNPVNFTLKQVKSHGIKEAKRLSAQYKCNLSLKGIMDCGNYWTVTIG